MKKENWATDFLTNLAKIYADDVDVLEIIEDTIDSYGNYVTYVYKMESLRSILKIKLEAEEYKDTVEEMDKTRTKIHNSAIASTKIINRMCESSEIPLFFQGNIEDRVEVAEFIRDIVVNVFQNRRI
ncbi:conserved protein of unknown function [Acetoanaerobium sticklandii]|uniref:DUF3232 domain-containing protein n=1 Tax=Acetoanaerobium sticklandii (strain ATCC 12662 / DSM 519 / JCM 1433 / CCUG 9281 / NCIMB 10654 / HF) TaxID=499177 RepID=E3PY76_ACESD|nr:DUF3232 domain-containing protein [Acetoanaerobium sticklandii]CBH21391.1 conserved protein of unknown function [Acetoanaerobium sticklandii]